MLKKDSRVEVVYYSGTGGTAMAASYFCEALRKAGCFTNIHAISPEATDLGQHDLLILLFPLHACNAPEAVYKWIKNLPACDNKPAVVISVSGGGEICPNTAGRIGSIKRLKKKGYHVIYEQSLVMPSNCVVATNETLAVKLLEVLPDKVQRIVDDLLSGLVHKMPPLWYDRMFSKLGELEKPGVKLIGRLMKVSDQCDGCGWCCKHCPVENISLVSGRPKFGGKCHLCLCCIYGCPQKSVMPRIVKFFVIKEGYDLNRLQKKVPLPEPIDVETLAKGVLWGGVRKYLKEL